MHRRRASESLDIEESYVMENGNWMFNLRNQAYYEESYIIKVSIFIELRNKVTWISKVKFDHTA
jgi:hypothetical protein